MKISFVIPAYNEEKNIGGCVASIMQEISTEKVDAEVIVVNNASTDDTKKIASAFTTVIIVDEQRKGLVWARKAGFERSTGELIANIDADNMLPKGWLKQVLKRFEDPELSALSGPVVYYDTPRYVRFTTMLFFRLGYAANLLNKLLSGVNSMLQGGNFILRREILQKIGGFDTSISFYGEDTDIGRRVAQIGKVVWTFDLPINSSGRRIMEEGLFKVGFTYALNFLWITVAKKPFTKKYKDIRS